MGILESIWRVLELQFYGPLVVAILEVVAIILGLIFVRRDNTGIFFICYLAFDFIVLFGDVYLSISPLSIYLHQFTHITNALISLVELLIYYYFFIQVIKTKAVINALRIFRLIFITLVSIYVITKFDFISNRYSYISYLLGASEFLLLLPPCFVYYYELLKHDQSLIFNLYERPSFWIITGIFFYSVTTMPYFLINKFMADNHSEYVRLMGFLFFYLPFSINFIFLSKAFICKKTLTI
jgi:hypothetical protein